MNLCPKCHCGSISGPRYVKKALGRERLEYQCTRCGYIDETPTKDSPAYSESKPPLKGML